MYPIIIIHKHSITVLFTYRNCVNLEATYDIVTMVIKPNTLNLLDQEMVTCGGPQFHTACPLQNDSLSCDNLEKWVLPLHPFLVI